MSILSVTTPAEELLLLSIDELRAAIGSAAAAEDAVHALGLRVSATIAQACRVAAAGASPPTLRLESLSELYRLKSVQQHLVLSRFPVVSIDSATVNGTLLGQDEYEVDQAKGFLKLLCADQETCWPCGKIVVAYQAGWATVPEDLKLAAAKLAAVFWSERGRSDPNLRRENIPGLIEREWWVGPSDDPLVPAEVLDLLGPYKNLSIG